MPSEGRPAAGASDIRDRPVRSASESLPRAARSPASVESAGSRRRFCGPCSSGNTTGTTHVDPACGSIPLRRQTASDCEAFTPKQFSRASCRSAHSLARANQLRGNSSREFVSRVEPYDSPHRPARGKEGREPAIRGDALTKFSRSLGSLSRPSSSTGSREKRVTKRSANSPR
jgi:hypothetical protein